MKATEFRCLSVLGGWVTVLIDSVSGQELEQIGPVFRSVTELWTWQRDNLYKDSV